MDGEKWKINQRKRRSAPILPFGISEDILRPSEPKSQNDDKMNQDIDSNISTNQKIERIRKEEDIKTYFMNYYRTQTLQYQLIPTFLRLYKRKYLQNHRKGTFRVDGRIAESYKEYLMSAKESI